MKLAIILFAVATIGLMATCSKTSDDSESVITGKWRLTQMLADIGDGKGEFKPYLGDSTYITFGTDGSLSTNRPLLQSEYDKYTIVDKTHIWLINSTTQDSTQMTYNIFKGRLTLWLFCIEACGQRFERASE